MGCCEVCGEEPERCAHADRIAGLRVQVAAVTEALRDLVDALPKCDVVIMYGVGYASSSCRRPATKAYRRGEKRWCDRHAPADAPDYPRAAALRHALGWLEPEDPP